ncbi:MULTISPECIES: J domain-containing protein [unclassified Tolypothrix]|uniref:J domain-containing protein n=1 Tax=unclassified Tolypothrix TaxID=2649714 RepID=UPI0005EAA60A|nr:MULTISPECIES: J domain-containing protein [unclassified Tolypothrix]BAY92084.1 heat shock protein DnaJ domain-containing protein [Microchaete diplosiphon NIES-3275]EKF04709.1 putative chaperone DnaJ [Tolypothrix sp. PCC 7601]MBE9088094.1 J domain-containing protein [Tolypothrix sp. LEGE 11397]UYD26066.1 J domain-containing protein [Tolypothrix sp. PCC 7712]UYD31695.1 J domain-containing protein [Tolypothrix sp. PCC 7601]
MSLRIDRGLFKYDFIDHHAVLCVPIDADVKEIRKRYLSIARRLHPDANNNVSPTDKHLSSEFLSKLVNPAYEKITVERSRSEYMIILSHMGKRLVQEFTSVELHTEIGKKLATAPESTIDSLYKSAIAKIAETQYENLQHVPQVIAQISELNLVYLMRTAGKSLATPTPQMQSTMNSAPPPPNPATNTTAPPPAPAPAPESSVVEHYLRRAQSLIDKNQFSQAQVELQDALKLEPKNSRCHSLIGLVYLKQNRLKMAKIHFDNTLKLDPNDQTALSWKPKIEKALSQQSGGGKVTTPPNSTGKQPDKSGGGGLFGGLFGGKKK